MFELAQVNSGRVPGENEASHAPLSEAPGILAA